MIRRTFLTLAATAGAVALLGAAGFGNLVVRATDVRGGFASREVTDLLVDLSPPEITLTETLISAQGKLAVWVADAWILGLPGLRRSIAGKGQGGEAKPDE